MTGGTDTGMTGGTDTGMTGGTDTGMTGGTDTGMTGDTDTGMTGDTDTGMTGGTDTGMTGDTDTGMTGGGQTLTVPAGLARGTATPVYASDADNTLNSLDPEDQLPALSSRLPIRFERGTIERLSRQCHRRRR